MLSHLSLLFVAASVFDVVQFERFLTRALAQYPSLKIVHSPSFFLPFFSFLIRKQLRLFRLHATTSSSHVRVLDSMYTTSDYVGRKLLSRAPALS